MFSSVPSTQKLASFIFLFSVLPYKGKLSPASSSTGYFGSFSNISRCLPVVCRVIELCLGSWTQRWWNKAQAYIAANTAAKAISQHRRSTDFKMLYISKSKWKETDLKYIAQCFVFSISGRNAGGSGTFQQSFSWLHADFLPGEGKLKWRTISLCVFMCLTMPANGLDPQLNRLSTQSHPMETPWAWQVDHKNCFWHLVSPIWLIILLLISLTLPPSG